MSGRSSRSTVPRVVVAYPNGLVDRMEPGEIEEMICHLGRIAKTRRFDCTDRIFAIDALERLGLRSLLELTRIADDGLLWSSVRLAALTAIERIQLGEEAPRWGRPEAVMA
jgi:hypothetical protein